MEPQTSSPASSPAPTPAPARVWSPDVGGGPLFARTWRLSGAAYPAADGMELVLEVILPGMAALPGFSGASVVIDRATGEVITTAFWDSLEHLEASAVAARNASVAGGILADGATIEELRVCDVLAVVPTPAVADPGLRPPDSPPDSLPDTDRDATSPASGG